MAEDEADDGVEVTDVDLAVAVYVAIHVAIHVVIATSLALMGGSVVVAMATAVDDDINHLVGISYIDLTVTIHVTRDVSWRVANDLCKIAPDDSRMVGIDQWCKHVQCHAGIIIHFIEQPKVGIIETWRREGKTRQLGHLIAAIEYALADASDTASQCCAGELTATFESRRADGGHRVRNSHLGDFGTVRKIFGNQFHLLANLDIGDV